MFERIQDEQKSNLIDQKSGELPDYLEKFIQLDDNRFVRSIAHPLFLATEVTLLAFQPLFDGADIFRKKHIENLLLDNREKAEEYEKELNETLRSRIAKNGKQRFLGRF